MKKNRLSIILLILGLLIFVYPFISKFINHKNLSNVVIEYKKQIENEDKEKIDEQKKKYEKYNEQLLNNSTSNVNLLKPGKLLGYIEINKINVKLPIYEGTEDKTLLKGIGHLEKSMLPSRKYFYHSIFVGHTGITHMKIFDDLPKLKIGDEFSVTTLNETFCYKIYKTKKVLPNETKDLKVQDGKRLVTLVTCVPKYINSHRLLVMGESVN